MLQATLEHPQYGGDACALNVSKYGIHPKSHECIICQRDCGLLLSYGKRPGGGCEKYARCREY
jgi:hypothetical protein